MEQGDVGHRPCEPGDGGSGLQGLRVANYGMRVGEGTRRRGSGAAQPRSDAGECEASVERQATSTAELIAKGTRIGPAA